MTEPPYANALAFVIVAASAPRKRALNIGTITSSQAESTIDSCARTEYATDGRGASSSAATRRQRSGALLDRGVILGVGVNRVWTGTAGQVLCNDPAARGFSG